MGQRRLRHGMQFYGKIIKKSKAFQNVLKSVKCIIIRRTIFVSKNSTNSLHPDSQQFNVHAM